MCMHESVTVSRGAALCTTCAAGLRNRRPHTMKSDLAPARRAPALRASGRGSAFVGSCIFYF